MKIYYIGILRIDTTEIKPKGIPLCDEIMVDGLNYFVKKSVAPIAAFVAETVTVRVKDIDKTTVFDEESSLYVHVLNRKEGVSIAAVSDEEYPKLVAHSLLHKISDDFVAKYPRSAFINAGARSITFPELKDYIVRYQNPQEADSIMKIQKELDDTKNIMHQTMQSVLGRGEKLDDLVAKSDGLSAQSKMFYTQAKKQNSCCVVM